MSLGTPTYTPKPYAPGEKLLTVGEIGNKTGPFEAVVSTTPAGTRSIVVVRHLRRTVPLSDRQVLSVVDATSGFPLPKGCIVIGYRSGLTGHETR